MSISKIGSTAFKGYLEIQHKNGSNCFDAKTLDKVVVNGKRRGVFIAGQEVNGKYTRMLIPYYAISQDKVLAAYKAARNMSDNAVLTLIINDKCLVKSR